jgi:uncharacterized protein YjlB
LEENQDVDPTFQYKKSWENAYKIILFEFNHQHVQAHQSITIVETSSKEK